jgi:hypothetical protein
VEGPTVLISGEDLPGSCSDVPDFQLFRWLITISCFLEPGSIDHLNRNLVIHSQETAAIFPDIVV